VDEVSIPAIWPTELQRGSGAEVQARPYPSNTVSPDLSGQLGLERRAT
jgi:hypothetical protein